MILMSTISGQVFDPVQWISLQNMSIIGETGIRVYEQRIGLTFMSDTTYDNR